MSTRVLVCGQLFDGLSDTLTGPVEILVEGNRIAKIERSVGRPPGATKLRRGMREGKASNLLTATYVEANLRLRRDPPKPSHASSRRSPRTMNSAMPMTHMKSMTLAPSKPTDM
jgi:hypothetical protein